MDSLFPAICVADVPASRDFYVALLGCRVVFDSGWYVQLQAPDDPTVQLGLVARDHDTVPSAFRLAPAGVLISVEVDDVDAVHERARDLGLEIALTLRSEDFGQRHFMTVDPDALLVDVITVIPMAPGLAAAAAVSPA